MARAPLPIDPLLPKIVETMKARGVAVLQAPPGAGKTTRVPLALLEAEAIEGKLLMLEPRRLAARTAAARLASELGEPLGERVGYAMRGERVAGPKTRIEVITEGILTRRLQRDPDLPGIGAILFDEFHERAMVADLGLALAWEARGALRPDLKLLVMSATLDAEPIAAMLDNAPVLTSKGRSFPVTEHFLEKPKARDVRLDAATATLVMDAHGSHEGSILVFLPGEGEIRRVQARLQELVPKTTAICPLFGALPFKDQQRAIQPAPKGTRKIVLATSIAETSLTIEDIRIVVDAGQARRARFDPSSGMTRLVTERVTKAEATQRAGRAGRVAEGHAYKLWTKGQNGALQAFPPPEIAAGDLTSLALDLAAWGTEPADLAFLTPPPEGAYAEAKALLRSLGALDGDRITTHGQALLKVPLHPRLAHMLLEAGPVAAPVAAILTARRRERNIGTELEAHLRQLRKDPKGAVAREAKLLAKHAGPASGLSAAESLALAYPDRIGKRRKGEAPRFLLSGGKGAVLAGDDALSGASFLVAADLDGDLREAKIRLAAALTESQIRSLFPVEEHAVAEWDKRTQSVSARKETRVGAIVLDDARWKDAPDAALVAAMLDGVAQLGLPFEPKSRRLQARILRAATAGHDLPDVSDAALMAARETWLAPFLSGIKTGAALKELSLIPALEALLGWEGKQLVDRLCPSHFTTPLGHRTPITYGEEGPEISLRLQELFGQTTHPMIAGEPIKLVLLSPARRPIQVTKDLPGFWSGSYADVRKDMRAQYPKHPWPEDPRQAEATLRAKPRKS